MTTVPAELKPISAFVARANELAKAEPVVAYWCTYYAVQTGMTLGAKGAESNAFLFALMDKLELMKEELAQNEAVVDEAVASAYVDNFSSKIFDQADQEDRSGKSTRMTAKKFLAAANFLEILSVFGASPTEVTDKIKYAKWKASDIAKAFREGRTPAPGPAGGLESDSEIEVVANDEGEKALAQELLSMGPPATAFEPLDLTPSAVPALIDDERPTTPDFPSFLNTPTLFPDISSPAVSTPSIPTSHQTGNLPPPAHTPSAAFPAAVFPSAPSLPSPATPSYFPPLPTPPPVSSNISTPKAASVTLPTVSLGGSAPESLDPSVIAKIQKHAKWAISALNYDDLATARKELHAALALLG